MANVCEQNLYIIADTGEDMKAILREMAGHFLKATNVDLLDGLDEDADWRTYAQAISSGTRNYNMLCLLADEPDSRAESGWFNSGGKTFGKPYVAVNMGLKWGPSHQVQEFCSGRDASKYGFACINGGEYMCAMGDDTAFIQWGENFGDPFSGGVDCKEYLAMVEEAKSDNPETLHEMALRKLFSSEAVSTFFWGSDDEEYDDEFEDEDGYYDEDEGYIPWGELNWNNPNTRDLGRIKTLLPKVASALPVTMRVSSGWTAAGNEAVEMMLPGDEVRVVGKWGKSKFVALCVETIDGTKIGQIGEWEQIVEGYYENQIAHGVLALMLPYVEATVESLTPMSLRNATAEGPKLEIRFDMVEADLNEVRERAHEMLEKSCSERSLSSRTEEAM